MMDAWAIVINNLDRNFFDLQNTQITYPNSKNSRKKDQNS